MPDLQGHIVVVDDEDTVRTVIVNLLEKEGYRTTAFADTVPALSVDLDDVDLIITDLAMPTSGEELIEAIRGRGFEGPIIVLTGVLENTDMHHLESIGADRILQKPVRMATLASTVELLLSGRKEEPQHN